MNLILPSEEDFLITYHIVNEETVTFIRPKNIMASWTQDNLHFRSSVWDSEGNLISAGFKKFFNLEEKPDIHPFSGDLSTALCVEKLDGSCLIVSKFRGVPIIRTRGSFDTSSMKNHYEIEGFLKGSLGRLLEIMGSDSTFLFEWQSPDHQIVIKHKQPELVLIGAVYNSDYSMWGQEELDIIATVYKFKRPTVYSFASKSEMVKSIEALEGHEGICLYYNGGQNIRKVKSAWYLKLHAFKSECSLKTLTKLYFERGMPSRTEFSTYVQNQFDYECLIMAEPFLDQLFKGVEVVLNWTGKVLNYTESSAKLSQKDFALSLIKFCDNQMDLAAVGFSRRKGINVTSNVQKCIMNNLGL